MQKCCSEDGLFLSKEFQHFSGINVSALPFYSVCIALCVALCVEQRQGYFLTSFAGSRVRIRGSSPSSSGSSPLNITSTPPPDTGSPGGKKVRKDAHSSNTTCWETFTVLIGFRCPCLSAEALRRKFESMTTWFNAKMLTLFDDCVSASIAAYRPGLFRSQAFFFFGYAHALAPFVVAYAPQGKSPEGRILLSPNRTHKTS